MVQTGEGGKRAGSILFFQLRLIITKNITNLLGLLLQKISQIYYLFCKIHDRIVYVSDLVPKRVKKII